MSFVRVGVFVLSVCASVTALGAGVTVTSPSSGATVESPVHFSATATPSTGRKITSMVVYIDNQQAGPFVYSNSLNENLVVAPGSHQFLVQAWDNKGTVYKSALIPISVSTSSGPSVTLSSATMNFGNVSINTTSSAQAVTLTNTGGSTLTFSGAFILSGAGFSWGTNGSCTLGGLAPGASCVITAVFSPTSAALFTGSITINDNTPTSPHVISLSGTGVSLVASPTPTPAPTPTPTPTPVPSVCSGTVSNMAYFVSTSGNNSNNGSCASPWATIQHAASVVTAGATVNVAAGTYQECLTTSASGTASAHIRFISTTKWGAKVVGSGCSTTEAVWQVPGSYVDIVNFEVTSTDSIERQGIWLTGSYDVVQGNHVHNLALPCNVNGGAGINAGDYYHSNNDIIGNVIDHIGAAGSACNGIHGIYISQPYDRVWNNISFGNISTGINMNHDSAGYAQIVNNTIFNNGTAIGGGSCYGAGIAIWGSYNTNTVVANNILRDNNCWAMLQDSTNTTTSNRYVNNLLYNNLYSINVGGSVQSGNFSADPLFVNYNSNGGGDYHLQTTSPAIDKGTSLDAPAYDFDGYARPYGGAFDIGAYEWHP